MQSNDSIQSQMANYDCPKADVSGRSPPELDSSIQGQQRIGMLAGSVPN
jgi:hypothetical protein